MMDTKTLAQLLNGREYTEEMDGIGEQELEREGIVVLFGYSDDNIEFRGAIHMEIGCYGGTEVEVGPNGLIGNKCPEEDCPYFEEVEGHGSKIEAVWNENGNLEYSWQFETDIPHETFDILENGEKFCRGIVFLLKDAAIIPVCEWVVLDYGSDPQAFLCERCGARENLLAKRNAMSVLERLGNAFTLKHKDCPERK